MKIAVVGLGKIGLPLAAQFANKGHEVVGIDINAETVSAVNAGKEPFPGEADLQDCLQRLVPSGNLRATTSYADGIPSADVIVVVVPLFVDSDGEPDFGWMDASTTDIGLNLTTDTVVIYETTLPVGTTRTRWKPALESGSGLKEGTDFHLVFSPERVLTGRVFQDLRRYPKLIGAFTPSGADAATGFYNAAIDFEPRPDLPIANGVWDLASPEAAEMAKLVETTYRDVNIALANQFATFAETAGVDVHRVIAAANSQPFSHVHRPGISVGGHCIPIYPLLYLTNDPTATVVRAARDANASMPKRTVQRLAQAYGDLRGARVAVLGAAYRGGVKETAFSGVFPLVDELNRQGAIALVHDPLYSAEELDALQLQSYELGEAVEAVILHTDHLFYQTVKPRDFPGVKLVVDGRAFWSDRQTSHITVGVPYVDHQLLP